MEIIDGKWRKYGPPAPHALFLGAGQGAGAVSVVIYRIVLEIRTFRAKDAKRPTETADATP